LLQAYEKNVHNLSIILINYHCLFAHVVYLKSCDTGWSKSLCAPDDCNHQVNRDFLIAL